MNSARKLLVAIFPVVMFGVGCQKPTAPAAPPTGGSALPSATVDKPPAEEPVDAPPATVAAEPESEAAENQENTAPVTAEVAPVDLKEYVGFKAEWFDGATQYPWPGVPRGLQTFADVPLEISGAIFLWGERNTSRGMVYPEEVTGIAIGRKFETLYVCHSAFFEAKPGTPMCEVRFQYDDGTSASDAIVCGDDARDWFINTPGEPLGPSGKRSTLAWDGEGKIGDRMQPIRFCLTAITNPHPDKVVAAIDLVSSKTQTAACILAITVGDAGLMQKAEEKPAADEKSTPKE